MQNICPIYYDGRVGGGMVWGRVVLSLGCCAGGSPNPSNGEGGVFLCGSVHRGPLAPTGFSPGMIALFTACVPDYTGAALIMARTGDRSCLSCYCTDPFLPPYSLLHSL